MEREKEILKRPLRRREALLAFGAAAAAALWQIACGSKDSGRAESTSSEKVCVLSPEVTEGPYWIPNDLTRRDVTDGRPGVPLGLQIAVVDAESCRPIENADV